MSSTTTGGVSHGCVPRLRQCLDFRAPTTRVWCGTANPVSLPRTVQTPHGGRNAQRLILTAASINASGLFTGPVGCVEGYRSYLAFSLLRVT
jgi:hypothetical protein